MLHGKHVHIPCTLAMQHKQPHIATEIIYPDKDAPSPQNQPIDTTHKV